MVTNDDMIAKLPKERQDAINKAVQEEIEKYKKLESLEEDNLHSLPKEIIEIAETLLTYSVKELKILFSKKDICKDADAFEMYKKCEINGHNYLLSRINGNDFIFVQLENPDDVYTEWNVYKDKLKQI